MMITKTYIILSICLILLVQEYKTTASTDPLCDSATNGLKQAFYTLFEIYKGYIKNETPSDWQSFGTYTQLSLKQFEDYGTEWFNFFTAKANQLNLYTCPHFKTAVTNGINAYYKTAIFYVAQNEIPIKQLLDGELQKVSQ